jgi:hypothetical protein
LAGQNEFLQALAPDAVDLSHLLRAYLKQRLGDDVLTVGADVFLRVGGVVLLEGDLPNRSVLVLLLLVVLQQKQQLSDYLAARAVVIDQ